VAPRRFDRSKSTAVFAKVEDPETMPYYAWFKRKSRPEILEVDGLGVNAYNPALEDADMEKLFPNIDYHQIAEDFELPDAIADFDEVGSVNLDLFSWLFNHELPQGQTLHDIHEVVATSTT